ncbi:MAG TPA: trehalase family glycosidase [Aggregatilinea sp.]|uniref:MGH1-like glycoside hydrolase domain-containing protein n=1 Tax=Aggregatilinea sp. TaxID=2806333 RepID=UPI002D194DCE|nr:trehalase family glycosidase [Aggregatilinea sp.]HML20888.1 trehalase family glycosidase [Aggregatilinea sp.]
MDLTTYSQQLRQHIQGDYSGMFREAGGNMPYPFLVPGSDQYSDVLWDWDSWLSDVALRQILLESENPDAAAHVLKYEQGCVLNFLSYGGMDGWVPILIERGLEVDRPARIFEENMHKPVLAQHAAFITQQCGDAEWLRGKMYFLLTFLNNYASHHRHESGLFYWQTDRMIGVDNDPCTFYRPAKSSGSLFLNCLMLRELEAAAYLCDELQLDEVGLNLRQDAESLKAAVQEHCWDERDGYFYNVDLNLLPVDHTAWLHSGYPRHWNTLIQRIGVWTGFMALWAGIATPEQAERIVHEHYRNEKTFNAPFGVRSLSKMEKMYSIRASGNPSSWLGPVWGIVNYMTFRGLVKYGFTSDARSLAEKTIALFGRDLERFGALHEYYQPENGEPILNRGFQNWNYLVLNMIAWLEDRDVVAEF